MEMKQRMGWERCSERIGPQQEAQETGEGTGPRTRTRTMHRRAGPAPRIGVGIMLRKIVEEIEDMI